MEDWKLSPEEAIERQKELRGLTRLNPLTRPIQTIGGADIAYDQSSDTIYAGIVILDYESMDVLLCCSVEDRMQFPYIPGLLSFREIPAIMKAWNNLPYSPDVLMMDGHGIAHPRRVGVATHFGILTGCPTLGCGKTHLLGEYAALGVEKGSASALLDQGETIGHVVRTRENVKQVWISPGHGMSMEQSVEIALHCAREYRIPEPTRQADLLVNAIRRGERKVGVEVLK
ncbi:MAG: endonuclease V [Saprospiraceae bacterium]|nr:endonuclease V [Saprospiraceae bacterium]